MFNGSTIWLLYIIAIIVAYLIFAYLLKWGVAFSLFLAFVVGILVVFLVPKNVTNAGDVAAFTALTAISSFLVIASFVWVIVSSKYFTQ